MILHHLQLQIDTWRSFFFIRQATLAECCEVYRDIRKHLRDSGITYPCRLKRTPTVDVQSIEENQEQHHNIAEAIHNYCSARADWNETDDDPNLLDNE